MTLRTGSRRPGRVRSARLTDLAALGDLSRLSHANGSERAESGRGTAAAGVRVRSLGLPVSSGQVSVFSLFRMPLRAFRPHDQLYVYEEGGHVSGLARVEREEPRDEWTIVELDAVDNGEAGDVRFRLIQHLLRDGGRRGAARFHVACAEVDSNVELFMQAGFARYGEESLMYRPASAPLPRLARPNDAAGQGIRPAVPLDAIALDRLYRAATPAPVYRLEGYRLSDWEHQGSHSPIPRSSLTPVLRFADVEAFVQQRGAEPEPELPGFIQVGVAKEDQPHYLRLICRPEHDPTDLIAYGLGVIGERSRSGLGERAGQERGIVTAVRTYEAPLDRRLEAAGFETIARVSLLLKETLVRVTEPALVPAASR